MKQNRMKAKLLAGEPVIGFLCMGNWPEMVEIVGLLGGDYVFLDGEHGVLGLPEIAGLVRAAEAAGITPIARVPRNVPDLILGYLDAGVQGIIVPNVDAREEAERVVKAVKYYPEGMRGCGYGHSADWLIKQPFTEYIKESNRETLVCVQCESTQGLQNLAEIARVPGVDVIMPGHMCLAQSLGIPGQFDNPLLQEALVSVREITLAAGKWVACGARDGDHARELIAEGWHVIIFGIHSLLINSVRKCLKKAKALG